MVIKFSLLGRILVWFINELFKEIQLTELKHCNQIHFHNWKLSLVTIMTKFLFVHSGSLPSKLQEYELIISE